MSTFFWDLHQDRRIAAAETMAESATSQASDFRGATQELRDRLDRLVLASMALWELLRERTDLTEEDLLKKVQEIDLRDGQADGRVTRPPRKCPKCGRVVSRRHARCLYCGAANLGHEAFDSAL